MNNTQQRPVNDIQAQPVQEQTIVSFAQGGIPSDTSQGNTTVNQHQQNQAITTKQNGFAQQPGGVGFHKELEPMPSLQTHTEWMTPVENQMELEPDVEEAGVEPVPAAPHISQEEKNLGLRLAKEAAKIEKSPGIQLKVPMTKAQAQQLTQGSLLTKNTANPLLWLAMLVYRQFQIAERDEK